MFAAMGQPVIFGSDMMAVNVGQFSTRRRQTRVSACQEHVVSQVRGDISERAANLTGPAVRGRTIRKIPGRRTGEHWMTTAWHDLQHDPITWEMFLDIDEDIHRDLEIVDGYVVPREQRSRDEHRGRRPSVGGAADRSQA